MSRKLTVIVLSDRVINSLPIEWWENVDAIDVPDALYKARLSALRKQPNETTQRKRGDT